MAKINIKNLIGHMTVEQQILAQYFYSKFDNRSAAYKEIINVEPIYYCGAIAGGEFLIYNVAKLYLCFSIVVGINASFEPSLGNVIFYDENNAVISYLNDNTCDTGAINNISNTCECKNIYFSRFGVSLYTHMMFIGYRITLL